MGKKLNALLGRKFKAGKFKITANLAVSRLAVLKNHRQARLAVARSDVTQLLRLNHHEQALLRVDQVIKEQNMFDVFVTLDGYCHLLLQRINLIKEEKNCPNELKEAVSSLIYAAPRCGEFPEIQDIRGIFTARYGKEFAYGAMELRNNCGVNPKMIQNLSPRQSSLEIRTKILTEIASEIGVVLKLENPFPAITEIERKEVRRYPEADSKVENDSTVLPDEVEQALSFSGSMNGRRKYRDVVDAAQDAFESAAYAAAAARAAVELSRSGSSGSDCPDGPDSRPRKVLDSKPTKSRLQIVYDKTHKSESESESESERGREVISVGNEGEGSKSNTNASDSDGYKASEKPLDFDESDGEIEERRVFSSFHHQGSPKLELGQLHLSNGPVSVRTRRVYGR